MTYKEDIFGESPAETQSCTWYQEMPMSTEKCLDILVFENQKPRARGGSKTAATSKV